MFRLNSPSTSGVHFAWQLVEHIFLPTGQVPLTGKIRRYSQLPFEPSYWTFNAFRSKINIINSNGSEVAIASANVAIWDGKVRSSPGLSYLLLWSGMTRVCKWFVIQCQHSACHWKSWDDCTAISSLSGSVSKAYPWFSPTGTWTRAERLWVEGLVDTLASPILNGSSKINIEWDRVHIHQSILQVTKLDERLPGENELRCKKQKR